MQFIQHRDTQWHSLRYMIILIPKGQARLWRDSYGTAIDQGQTNGQATNNPHLRQVRKRTGCALVRALVRVHTH